MSDFTAEDLFDAVDRLVADLLARHGITEPPVDAIVLAQDEFDLTVREADDEDDPRSGRFGPQPPRFNRRREVVFRPDHSDLARHALCARACAREMIPAILTRLRKGGRTTYPNVARVLTWLGPPASRFVKAVNP